MFQIFLALLLLYQIYYKCIYNLELLNIIPTGFEKFHFDVFFLITFYFLSKPCRDGINLED